MLQQALVVYYCDRHLRFNYLMLKAASQQSEVAKQPPTQVYGNSSGAGIYTMRTDSRATQAAKKWN